MTLLALFPEQYWIPIGLLVAAIWSAIRGIRASKSGSTQQIPGGGTVSSNKNVSYFKTGGGVFSIIFLLAAIGAFIWMYSER